MRPLTLAKTAGGAFAAAAAGGLATTPAVESAWYRRLKKPGFQPPRLAFPIAWNILYTDIAVVSASTRSYTRATCPVSRVEVASRQV